MANIAICCNCEDAFCDECDPLTQCADIGFHCDECGSTCGPCKQAERDDYHEGAGR